MGFESIRNSISTQEQETQNIEKQTHDALHTLKKQVLSYTQNNPTDTQKLQDKQQLTQIIQTIDNQISQTEKALQSIQEQLIQKTNMHAKVLRLYNKRKDFLQRKFADSAIRERKLANFLARRPMREVQAILALQDDIAFHRQQLRILGERKNQAITTDMRLQAHIDNDTQTTQNSDTNRAPDTENVPTESKEEEIPINNTNNVEGVEQYGGKVFFIPEIGDILLIKESTFAGKKCLKIGKCDENNHHFEYGGTVKFPQSLDNPKVSNSMLYTPPNGKVYMIKLGWDESKQNIVTMRLSQ